MRGAHRPDLGEVPDNLEAEAEKAAWECFATAHPHEAYETWPDRFWQFFHTKAPNVSRERMVEILKETEGIQ